MPRLRLAIARAILGVAAAGWFAVGAAQGPLPGVEPLHESGQDVTPAFEGWYPNPDGTFDLSFGYMNRNLRQELDIPIGPNNRIEPGQADQGQPTHFLARRQYGLFTVTVPKDFGTKRITWTLVANGRINTVPGDLDRRWEIDALLDGTVGNTPPVISFVQGGASGQGPHPLTTMTTVTLPNSAALDVWAKDDGKSKNRNPTGPPVVLTWSKYRGPGEVTFASRKPEIDKASGHAATTATFSTPGDYMVRVVANDSSGDGGGGFQCCWTNGLVKVAVKAAGTH